jgi:hypothetical protein
MIKVGDYITINVLQPKYSTFTSNKQVKEIKLDLSTKIFSLKLDDATSIKFLPSIINYDYELNSLFVALPGSEEFNKIQFSKYKITKARPYHYCTIN